MTLTGEVRIDELTASALQPTGSIESALSLPGSH